MLKRHLTGSRGSKSIDHSSPYALTKRKVGRVTVCCYRVN